VVIQTKGESQNRKARLTYCSRIVIVFAGVIMNVRTTLMPGQNGTKQLVEQYGDQLVCVRYRYDEARKRRVKTIELIIEDTPWQKELPGGIRLPRPKLKHIHDVLVRIAFHETDLRTQVKQAGAQWIKDEKAWRLDHQTVVNLGLENRIIKLIDVDELGF
jgi:hypothetical protein